MNEKTLLWILLAAALLLTAVIVILSRKRGLPGGELIYDDLSHDGTPIEPLFSARYGLRGKPDMILRNGDRLIPVEVKHTAGRDRPYPGHTLQLAAYCVLIEEHYGIRPEYGILRYRDKDFEIPFTDELKEKLLSQMKRMRAEDPKTRLPEKCSQTRKCTRCGFSEICAQLSDQEF